MQGLCPPGLDPSDTWGQGCELPSMAPGPTRHGQGLANPDRAQSGPYLGRASPLP